MTADELNDLRNIAASVRRIESRQDADSQRLDKLERFADRAEGALTLVKFVMSFLGLGGVAAFIVVVTRGGL
jgi:Flp pilus assembly protein TadB